MPDVWIVTNWQALQWVRDPTPISRLNNFQPFQCNYAVSKFLTFPYNLFMIFTLFGIVCCNAFLFLRIDPRSATMLKFVIFGTNQEWDTWEHVNHVLKSTLGLAKLALGHRGSTTTSKNKRILLLVINKLHPSLLKWSIRISF